MRGWAWGGIATTVFLLGSGAAWTTTAWGELRVVASTNTPAAVDTSPPPPPQQLASPTTTTTPPALPAVPPCGIADEPAQGDPLTDWGRIVVDAGRALPADFAPSDLVDVEAAGFNTGDQIRQIVVDDLAALRQAASDNGTPLVLISAYRSYTYQDGLFQTAVEENGLEEAQRTTARPGHSEHQLGTAIDLIDTTTSELTPAFAQTEAGQWLAANAHRFGFVISYPDVAPERSCYSFEPWHLRYVGRDTAVVVHDSGLTLREWQLSQ